MSTIDSVTAGVWGYTNIGQYTAEMDIWAPFTADRSWDFHFTAGSTTVTGFSSTADILPGMSDLQLSPDNIGNNALAYRGFGRRKFNRYVGSVVRHVHQRRCGIWFGEQRSYRVRPDHHDAVRDIAKRYSYHLVVSQFHLMTALFTPTLILPMATIPATPRQLGCHRYEVGAITNLSVTYNISVSAATNPNRL
jgi:hypothetical protein